MLATIFKSPKATETTINIIERYRYRQYMTCLVD